ncbi:MAG: O-antigen ligase family protein [Candidatus Binatia bacterium]
MGEKSLAVKASRTTFFFYVVFLLMGGTVPFQDKITDVSDVVTSNLSNQIIDTLFPFISLLCLLPKRKQLLLVLKQEKYLTLFLLWCLCSVLWSDFVLDSFKRWVRLFGSTIVILGFLLNTESPDEAFKYLRRVFVFYVPLSLLAIAFVPGAIQWEFPAWRGLASHKNTLGQISLISAIVWSFTSGVSSTGKKISRWLFLLASLILLFGSRSTTALVCFLFLLMTASWLIVERQLQNLNVGRLVSLTLVFCVSLLFLLVQALELNALESVTGVFGKDASFTGRTELWEAIFDEAKTHIFFGCGFGGFWVMENPAVLLLYADYNFPWLPNEAHLGYLDVLNETGIVGLSLLALMIIFYFRALSRFDKPHFWKWFFLCTLFINLQESTLFRVANFSGWLFVLSYLVLYVELIHSKMRVAEGRQLSEGYT